jgi:hypothetical protein
MTIGAALMFFTLLFTFSSNIDVSILSSGFTGKPSKLQNIVIKNEEELKRMWNQLEIEEEVPSIDFNKELAIVLVSRGKLGSSLEISRVERKANDAVDVRFVVKPVPGGLTNQRSQMFPYLVAKLYHLDVNKSKVKFIEDAPFPPVPVDSGIGQISNYTNVLKQYDGTSFQFFPLDKGNVWTYRIESKEKTKEETYSVLSISQDGWSVFDNFFGRKDIAMRIDPAGDIFVSSKNGVGDFYTQDIQKDFKKSEFSTPAGKFNDLMIVTVPENDRFWFKDVYAKGVGLIFHQHKSPKGTAKYTLIRAMVKGENYPKSARK